MTMDEHELQRRLHDAVRDTQPDSARLWEQIMDDTTHAHKMRNAKRTALVLTVLAFAIAVPVAINLASPDDGDLVTPPSASVSPPVSTTVTATPALAGTPYVHARMNLMLNVPDGWRTGEFEGHVEIYPESLPGPTEGGSTIYVDIFQGALEAPSGPPDTQIGGQDAWVSTGADWGATYTVEWPAGLALPDGAAEDGYLTIVTDDTTGGEFRSRYEQADAILESIRLPETLPAGTRTLTRFGEMTLAEIDDLTLTAIAFLDDRIFGGDPALWLTEQARRAYDDFGELPGGDPWLAAGTNGFYRDYVLLERREVDANSAEFDLELTYTVNDETYTVSETIGVGAGSNHAGARLDAVVRFATASVA